MPTIGRISKTRGIAGQFSLTAEVTYPGEVVDKVTFVSSADGAPIVMVLPSGIQTFVATTVLDRIGRTLTEEWVRRFFAEDAWVA